MINECYKYPKVSQWKKRLHTSELGNEGTSERNSQKGRAKFIIRHFKSSLRILRWSKEQYKKESEKLKIKVTDLKKSLLIQVICRRCRKPWKIWSKILPCISLCLANKNLNKTQRETGYGGRLGMGGLTSGRKGRSGRNGKQKEEGMSACTSESACTQEGWEDLEQALKQLTVSSFNYFQVLSFIFVASIYPTFIFMCMWY